MANSNCKSLLETMFGFKFQIILATLTQVFVACTDIILVFECDHVARAIDDADAVEVVNSFKHAVIFLAVAALCAAISAIPICVWDEGCTRGVAFAIAILMVMIQLILTSLVIVACVDYVHVHDNGKIGDFIDCAYYSCTTITEGSLDASDFLKKSMIVPIIANVISIVTCLFMGCVTFVLSLNRVHPSHQGNREEP